jgi:hypothetical protein
MTASCSGPIAAGSILLSLVLVPFPIPPQVVTVTGPTFQQLLLPRLAVQVTFYVVPTYFQETDVVSVDLVFLTRV